MTPKEESSMQARILSIQSHVVSGYVGNRAATFPLQLLGHEVDVINTVQFSNHTGYNNVHGQRFAAGHVLDLFAGLQANGLDCGYTHLLSGYMGNSENIRAVENIAKQLKDVNPQLVFVVDPVLGDDGALYVPEELIGLYRQVLCPMATLITPNQFEMELLTDTKIASLEDAKRACDIMHEAGVPNVVITSAQVAVDGQKNDGRTLRLIGSEYDRESGAKHQFAIVFPRLQGYFTGTGDFFTALTMARHASLRQEYDGLGALAKACELATATLAGVMKATVDFHKQSSDGSDIIRDMPRGSRPSEMVRAFELRIIPSQHLIVAPVAEFHAFNI
ncbi:Ribokinase-like protein [Coemansia reversa NRRL 1564]|uniref:pyridoxal kinase n=1 Tax=Coemansia reversa (strain ATCC 12441 / NRRL 1564) TaxID=763665 RepID=A0A2G5B3N1_COERN|nr:Ribokinase-like protein [Coemansia reversa NRRL 1564]|eukprot:PIA13591.1 Ribokinase-like protein [Coemansia reversa NRRL 1564]